MDIDKKIANWEVDIAYWRTDKTRLLDEACDTCEDIIEQLKACREEIEARELLCMAYRLGDQKRAVRALTMLEKLGVK